MGKRLMTYKDITAEYGMSDLFWRRQYWRGKLKNCGFTNKHVFDRPDIEKLIQDLKQVA